MCGSPGPGVCPSCGVGLAPAVGSPFPACFAYAAGGRALVGALKYRNGRAAVPWLAERLVALVGTANVVDAVTWVPTGAGRRRRRGYDQAEVLARAVGRRLGVPAPRLLVRRATSGPQTGRTRAERLSGPSFLARCPVGGTVLVVDDVVTTGASLRAARAALVAAGARDVHAVALAATAARRWSSTTRGRSRSSPVDGTPATGAATS